MTDPFIDELLTDLGRLGCDVFTARRASVEMRNRLLRGNPFKVRTFKVGIPNAIPIDRDAWVSSKRATPEQWRTAVGAVSANYLARREPWAYFVVVLWAAREALDPQRGITWGATA